MRCAACFQRCTVHRGPRPSAVHKRSQHSHRADPEATYLSSATVRARCSLSIRPLPLLRAIRATNQHHTARHHTTIPPGSHRTVLRTLHNTHTNQSHNAQPPSPLLCFASLRHGLLCTRQLNSAQLSYMRASHHQTASALVLSDFLELVYLIEPSHTLCALPSPAIQLGEPTISDCIVPQPHPPLSAHS